MHDTPVSQRSAQDGFLRYSGVISLCHAATAEKVMDTKTRHSFPVYESPDYVQWVDAGRRVKLDSKLADHLSVKVYRYCSLAEALMILRSRSWAFARPSAWPDVYEKHVGVELFADAAVFEKLPGYVKCVSLEYSSEAMWRAYSSPGGLVRLSWVLSDLVDVLDAATFPEDGKIYLAAARYVEAPTIRSEVARVKKMGAKQVSQEAMRILMMKRFGFASENEIRICFFPAKKHLGDYCVARLPSDLKVDRLLIDPYLPSWQARELAAMFTKDVKVPFPVSQSRFDTVYDSASDKMKKRSKKSDP